MAILIIAFSLPHFYDPQFGKHPSLFAVILYLQCTLWAITVVSVWTISPCDYIYRYFSIDRWQLVDQLTSKQHLKSQLRGYLEFNRTILPRLRLLLITVTSCKYDLFGRYWTLKQLVSFLILAGSILLLTIAAVAWDYCPREGSCSDTAPLTPTHYVQIVLSLQTSILLPVTLSYCSEL